MESYWTGGDKSQIDATALEHQGGTSSSVLFSLKLDDSPRAFETVVFFSKPQRLLHIPFLVLNIECVCIIGGFRMCGIVCGSEFCVVLSGFTQKVRQSMSLSREQYCPSER